MFKTLVKKVLYFFGYTEDTEWVFISQKERRERLLSEEFHTAGAEWSPDMAEAYRRR